MKKVMFAAIAAMVMGSVSNVFASSRMVGNAEVAPVDTVAPETPKDSAEVSTPVLPQAGAEDSTDQATPAETTSEATSEATEATSETSAESVDTAQAEQPVAQATVSE